ncbi:MAG TPA: hypothetical protein VFN41_10770 [Candidatus Limnocylindrales bacterium]|nr:hypothetical protein [Candidatus Limnocylindrales bacterium]
MAVGWVGARSTIPSDEAAPVGSAIVRAEDITAAGAWVRLDLPARRDEVFTSRAITVRGEVGPAVSAVWLSLESRNGKILATRTIQRGDPSIRAPMPFEGLFGLASPGASGRLFVTATAIGVDGVPTQSIRRRIETTAASADPRADGLHRGPHADLGIDGGAVELAAP